MSRDSLRILLILCVLLSLGSCERIAQNMYNQPRDKPYSHDSFFSDGASSRTPPPGTMPYSRGASAEASSGRHGTDPVDQDGLAQAALTMPYPVTEQLLVRGRERFDIYCLPCHSPAGDGDGRIVRRGFPAPPSYHIDRLRNAPDRYFYDVISQGYGVMASYGDRIDPPDRWAIVAFIRALQLSQHATLATLPPDIRNEAAQALSKTPLQEAP